MVALAEELRRIGDEDCGLAPWMKDAARALELRATGGDVGMVVHLAGVDRLVAGRRE